MSTRHGPAADRRLGERLVAAGLVTAQQVDEALRAQRQVRGSLGYHLLRLGKITPQALTAFIEDEVARGRLAPPSPPPGEPGLAALPARLAHLYNAYPLTVEGHRLLLALPPMHGDAVSAIGEATGRVVEPIILPARLLREAIERDYLGAARAAVQHPAAGLTRFVVDDGDAVKPVAPPMRTDTVSPEVWLRSVLAEAVASRQRHVALHADEPLPAAQARAEAVIELVEDLARLPRRGPTRDRGRFQLELRGRRPIADVVRDGWQSPRIDIHLAEQRLFSEDPDELFAGRPEAQDAVEALAQGTRGLMLVVAPSGAGGRRLVRVLGARLAEVVPGAEWIGADPPAGFAHAREGADDERAAAALHEALDATAPLIVAEELKGSRSFERALLVAARTPVLAGFVASDASATLSWLLRQGLAGALKVGLLRGVVSLLGTDEPCACAAARAVPEELAGRWGMQAPVAARGNVGCAACLEQPVRRTHVTLTWTPVAGRPDAEYLVEDEERARRARAERGDPAVLAAALAGGADATSALMLLQAAP